ncbi:MAG: helix-turn-helix transcriptional regulator [Flavobacteriales bacterium]|nr:helix-turn-helix transcriptional regulator [Flavobacteriales bacterium]
MNEMLLGKRVGENRLLKASELLRTAAHPQRLAILDLLGRHERLCNLEMQEMLGIEQAILSQHLSLMRDRGLVDFEKDGRFSRYFIRQPEFLRIIGCLERCCEKL